MAQKSVEAPPRIFQAPDWSEMLAPEAAFVSRNVVPIVRLHPKWIGVAVLLKVIDNGVPIHHVAIARFEASHRVVDIFVVHKERLIQHAYLSNQTSADQHRSPYNQAGGGVLRRPSLRDCNIVRLLVDSSVHIA